MRFAEPLIPGRLIRRYKRFLADVDIGGREVTAHCANPGAMTGLAEPGSKVWLEPNDDPKKKLKFSWKLVELPGGLACVDTAIPNRVVGEALEARAIPALAHYDEVRREVRYGEGSRVDFLLTGGGPDCWLEVKCVTLREGARAAFPDAKTARGARHLGELAEMAKRGDRAALLYLIHRTDCAEAGLADWIDPAYAAAHEAAAAAGVETMVWTAHIDWEGVTLGAQGAFVGPARGPAPCNEPATSV